MCLSVTLLPPPGADFSPTYAGPAPGQRQASAGPARGLRKGDTDGSVMCHESGRMPTGPAAAQASTQTAAWQAAQRRLRLFGLASSPSVRCAAADKPPSVHTVTHKPPPGPVPPWPELPRQTGRMMSQRRTDQRDHPGQSESLRSRGPGVEAPVSVHAQSGPPWGRGPVQAVVQTDSDWTEIAQWTY